MTNNTYLFKNSRKSSTLWVFFGGLFIAAMAIIYIRIVKEYPIEFLPLAIMGVAAVVVLTLLVFFLSKNTFIRFEEKEFILVKGKKEERYSYDDFAGSNVTRHYHNGIYTGSTRAIKVYTTNGKTTQIESSGINKHQFAEVVAKISKNKFVQDENISIPDDYFDKEFTFEIPNKKIISKTRGSAIANTIIALLGAALILGIWFVMRYGDPRMNQFESNQSTTRAFAVIAALIVVAVIIFVVRVWIKFSHFTKMPARVSVGFGSLKVDDKTFGSSSIESISMVPGSYDILKRDMLVIMKDGSKHFYSFGESRKKIKRSYSEYESMYDLIKLWCMVSNINFVSILG